MKKILSFALALLMLATFAACGTQGGNSDAGASDVEKVISEFHNALFSLDVEKALTYTLEDSEAYNDIAESGSVLDFDTLVNSIPEELASEEMTEVINGVVEDIKGLMKEYSSYKILETKEEGDTAVVRIKTTVPTQESLTSIDVTEMYDSQALVSLVIGSFTEEELAELITLSEEDVQEAMMAKMPSIMKTVFDEVIATVEENIETGDSESNYTLEKIDGKWLIVSCEDIIAE